MLFGEPGSRATYRLLGRNRVVKTNASEFDAFSSPNYPALADYGINLTVDVANVLPPPVSHGVSLDNEAVLRLPSRSSNS